MNSMPPPETNTVTLYEAVTKMRIAPIGRASLLPIVLAVGLPMLPVLAIEIPIKDLLLKLLTTLA